MSKLMSTEKKEEKNTRWNTFVEAYSWSSTLDYLFISTWSVKFRILQNQESTMLQMMWFGEFVAHFSSEMYIIA